MRVESFPLSRDTAIPTRAQDLRPVASAYEEDGKDKPERDRSKDLNRAVDKLNQATGLLNRHLKFRMHKETKTTIVQVIDSESDQVLREFPPEKMLDMLANLEKAVGIIIDKYV